jgi:phenylacetate-CoA ligase
LVLERKKALDTLEVQVEITEQLVSRWGNFEDGHVEMSALTERIQMLFKDGLGLTAEVTLLKPKSIARSEGKAVRVVDRRTENK